MKKKALRILSYILVAALASGITFGLMAISAVPETKLSQLQALIEERFIGEYDETEMEDAAADAMIQSLGDQWSYYIPAGEYADYEEQVENAYVGIGITISQLTDGSGLLVESVQKDGPADQAGMLPEDVIVSIDGQTTEGMSTTEARQIVRGEVGTGLTITVMRQGEAQTLYITRQQVNLIVAEGEMLTGEIGLVTITNFDSRCAEETLEAIEKLLDSGVKVLIFDVRNNPGGYASELVKVLDYLLPEGELFRTEDYAGRTSVDYSDKNYLDMPMAVLVNGDSYSAAEFFAAALQEYGVAKVIGEQTCGKGYFQNTFQFDDGSAVGLSVGKYFTPKGNCLANVGITPDMVVTVDEETAASIYYGTIDREEDPQLQEAVRYLTEVLEKKKT